MEMFEALYVLTSNIIRLAENETLSCYRLGRLLPSISIVRHKSWLSLFCQKQTLLPAGPELTIDRIPFALEEFSRIGWTCDAIQELSKHTDIIKQRNAGDCWTANQISQALYAFRGLTIDKPNIEQMGSAIAEMITTCPDRFQNIVIGKCMRGISKSNCKSYAVQQIVDAMTEKIMQSNESWTGQTIGTVVYSMKEMACGDYVGVPKLVRVVARKIRESRYRLNGVNIGNSLYGLKEMRSSCPEVLELVGSLEEKIYVSQTAKLTAIEFSNAMFGLRYLSDEHQEVRWLVATLASILKRQPDMYLDGFAFSSCMGGLKSMSSRYPEIIRFLNELSHHISSDSEEYDPKWIGNALSSMRLKSNLGGHNQSNPAANTTDPSELYCDEVRRILMIIDRKLDTCKPLTMASIGNALFGLAKMDNRDHVIRSILTKLTSFMKSSDELLTPSSLRSAIFGIQNMDCNDLFVQNLLKALHTKLIQSKEALVLSSAVWRNLVEMVSQIYHSHKSPEVSAIIETLLQVKCLETHQN